MRNLILLLTFLLISADNPIDQILQDIKKKKDNDPLGQIIQDLEKNKQKEQKKLKGVEDDAVPSWHYEMRWCPQCGRFHQFRVPGPEKDSQTDYNCNNGA